MLAYQIRKVHCALLATLFMDPKIKAEQTPSFFKVLVGDHYKEKLARASKYICSRLRGNIKYKEIPQGFIKYFNGKFPHQLVLRVYNRSFWYVEVKEVDGAFFFQDGWTSFLTDNLLEQGDFLVFKFTGNSVFEVIIFDNTACEKELPTHTKTEPPDSETHNQRNRKSVEYSEVCQCKYKVDSSFKIEGACKLQRRSEFDGTSCPFKITKPHFTVTYKQKAIVFPVTFCRGSGLVNKSSSFIYLHDPSGKSWQVTVRHWLDCRCNLGSEWKAFEAENRLRVGDRCAFELVNASDHERHELRVHIFRWGVMSCSCSNCSTHQELL